MKRVAISPTDKPHESEIGADESNSVTPRRLLFARIVSPLLVPFGLICLGVPFYMLSQPERWGMIDDTRAAFGAGRNAGLLKAAYVGCTRSRYGSSSSRGTGFTEYGCVIDLAEEKLAVEATPAPAAKAEPEGNQYAGLSFEEQMEKHAALMEEWSKANAEHTRQINAGIDALAEQRRAGEDTSNRIERILALDYSGEIPAVRILSAAGEPRRVGLFWGWGEIISRWGQLLMLCLLFFSFGFACLLPFKLAWFPKRQRQGG